MHPTGSISKEGGKLVANYAEGEDVGVTVALLGRSRNAVVFQFVGRQTERELYSQLVNQLALSTQFMNEKQTRLLRKWHEQLTGMVLKPKSDSVVEQRIGSRAIHLCSDGRFVTTLKLAPVPGRTKESDDEDYQETGSQLIERLDSSVRLILANTAEAQIHALRDDGAQLFLDGQPTEPAFSDRCF